MKTMRNLFSAVAFACAAVLAPTAAKAHSGDGQGDIYSIDVVDRSDYPEYGGITPTKDKPATLGDSIVLRVRFANPDFRVTGGGAGWEFTPKVPGLTDFFPPKLGILLGENAGEAEYLDTVKSPTGKFTDVFFRYRVQAGDLALPALLMAEGGKPAKGGAKYYLYNAEYWELCSVWSQSADEKIKVSANWSYGPDSRDIPEAGDPTRSIDGTGLNLYVKSVDFDSRYVVEPETPEDPGLWRKVYRTMTTTTTSLPSIVPEGVAERGAKLFVWVEDEEIAQPLLSEGAYYVDLLDKDGKPTGERRYVVPVTLAAGDPSKSFHLKGLKNGTTRIFMSSTPNNVYDGAEELIKNWMTRTIEVIDPPAPYVAITLGAEELKSASVTATDDYRTEVTTVNVMLSQECTKPVTVDIDPQLEDGDVFDDDILGISLSPLGEPYAATDQKVTFEPGELVKTFHVYAKGVTPKSKTKGIKFNPVLSGEGAAEFKSDGLEATLLVAGMKPVIATPSDGQEIDDVVAGQGYPFDVLVRDTYKNKLEGNIYWDAGSGTGYRVFYNIGAGWVGKKGTEADPYLTADEDSYDADTGAFTFSITFPAAGEYNVQLQVKNSDGVTSEIRNFKVTVKDGKSAWAVFDTDRYAESGEAEVKFFVSAPQPKGKDMWCFLEPINDDAKQKADGSCLTTKTGAESIGCYIPAGKTESTGVAVIRLLDGPANPVFKVHTRLSQDWKASGEDPYAGQQVDVRVTNIVAQVDSVSVGGAPVREAGATCGKKLSIGVEKEFKVNVKNECAYDLDATGGDVFRTRWTFNDGKPVVVEGRPSENPTTWTPNATGLLKVTVEFQDKDMRSTDAWSAPFEFYVEVLEAPAITIEPLNGEIYYEDQAGALKSPFKVNLNIPPDFADGDDKLRVKLWVTKRDGTTPVDPKVLKLSADFVDFTSGVSAQSFFFDTLDGTKESASGYQIHAAVDEAASDPDAEGKKWRSFVQPVYIINNDPVIDYPQPQILDKDGKPVPDPTEIGSLLSLDWSIRDIDADLGPELQVNLSTSEGEKATYHTATGSFSFSFKSSGKNKYVKLEVKDKDGGAATVALYYDVSASKSLTTVASGPSGGIGDSALSQRYQGARGIGAGHVWTEATFSGATQFSLTWNCGLMNSLFVYAWGYKVGAVDDGSLNGGSDVALDGSGNRKGKEKPATCYAYDDKERDSYLYAFIAHELPEGGGAIESLISGIAPERGASPSPPRSLVALPTTAGNKESEQSSGYKDTLREAVFSKERYPTDNMGDINWDGIPDVYLQAYRMDVLDATGAIVGDDLKSLAGYNADADFIPSTGASQYGTLIPNLSNTWVTLGTPFNALTEIRGYHWGLNGSEELAEIPYVKSERIYLADDGEGNMVWNEEKCTISELEFIAFTNWCARQSSPLDPTLKASWAKWSPERPTNPTAADTDLDGMPDGYEYFFWYRAHVGYLENDGTYRRLTGRRFVPTDPANAAIITADDIEKMMDPLDPAADAHLRDSDNDGLTDLVELELGTNPFDFDTDGDGLPDGYEVMIGTNPLLPATDRVTSDGERNDDRDFKAEGQIDLNWVDLENSGKPGVTNRFFSTGEFALTNIESVVTDEPYVTVTNRQVLSHGPLVSIWRYGVGNPKAPWALGGASGTASVTGATWTVVATGVEAGVRVLHYQVFEKNGFDPRVGWNDPKVAKNGHCIMTTPFTHLDEFLVMAFYYKNNGLSAGDLTVTRADQWLEKWANYCTSPLSADTDQDGMPDGWELYVQMGTGKSTGMGAETHCAPGPGCIYSPLYDFGKVTGGARDPEHLPFSDVGDGLHFVEEFAGIESVGRYSATCATIQLTTDQARWQNKWWPTDPYNADTDGDGIEDGAERVFLYGSARKGAIDDEGCIAGGGLNPLSWDTDKDGLPDPFELEFIGEGAWVASATSAGTAAGEANAAGETNATDKVETGTSPDPSAGQWNDLGMNGTVDDALKDYDHDGLANWQEYMVGAMRCWRYDDTVSHWDDGPFDPVAGGENQYQYFSLATNVFEQDAWVTNPKVYNCYYMFRDGHYHDLNSGTSANSFTAKDDMANTYSLKYSNGHAIYPHKYICANPLEYDTDHDGMDDFYELFHGLNPLLGESATISDTSPCDVVFAAYKKPNDAAVPWSAENNFWFEGATAKHLTRPEAGVPDEEGVLKPRVTKLSVDCNFDFFQYPWLGGLARADPDGDNIRNLSEAILPNVQAASTFRHTDPTPLWMTDHSYGASLVSRCYALPALSTAEPAPATITARWMGGGAAAGTMFSYEENEGFDSDHDFLGDFEESQGKTKRASDPQDHDDPRRRQAMWFNGEDAFLQSALPEYERFGNASAGQNYLYFTVECWAKPDAAWLDREQTLVERSVWTGPAGAADEKYLRKNFLIGIRGGRWYAMFDTDGVDLKQVVEIANGPVATTNWTYLVFTYGPENGDQNDAAQKMRPRLYVNGIAFSGDPTEAHPEHGISAFSLSAAGEEAGYNMWSDPLLGALVSFTVGASAETKNGICFDLGYRLGGEETTFADYGRFYRGYIDEVRIWDGARSEASIKADFDNRTRYDAKLVEENRLKFRYDWEQGGLRSPASDVNLAARLMHHWSFDHLAGAVEPTDLIDVPAGFRTGEDVTDGMAIWARPAGWTNNWWSSVAVRSTVYADTAWVPWINDTVSHLPRPDKTTLDSVYWSENYAGYQSATNFGYAQFVFPRTAEVPSRWVQVAGGDPMTRRNLVSSSGDEKMKSDYRFTMLDRQTAGFDLLPMGGAYPRRVSAAEGGMWDRNGAADAWAETGVDADHNSLPDWWENYARANYAKGLSPFEVFGWMTPVDYHGVTMQAWQAYLRDLAHGLLPDGKIHSEFADTRDLDKDGLPDWWAEMYGVSGADEDPDNDGLSNFQEYLLSEVYPYAYDLGADATVPLLDPTLAQSVAGQKVTDYFLRYSTNALDIVNDKGESVFGLNEYFGEIVADHDFMEDWWENQFDKSYTSAQVYDPLDDKDEDGWSNWAECRAALWGGFFDGSRIDSWTGIQSSQHVVAYPEPVIGIRATYHGAQDVSGRQLVIRTTTGQTPRMDATFVVPSTLDSQVRYIGPFKGDSTLHGHLSPGRLNVNSVIFERAEITAGKIYTWNCDWYKENVPEQGGWDLTWAVAARTHAGTYEQYQAEYDQYPMIKLESGDLIWSPLCETHESTSGNIDAIVGGITIGSIDSETGIYALDLSKVGSDFGNYVYRVTYSSRIGHEWPQTVYVSDTREMSGVGQGRVREGRNTIEVFMDMNGNGAYDKGEPFGSARNVLVGWHKVPTVTVELWDDDKSPVMPRVAIALDDKDKDKDENDKENVQSGGLVQTIQIVRRLINGQNEREDRRLNERVLATRELVLSDHPYFTEADVLNVTKPDLDFSWLARDAKKLGIENIENVTYGIEQVLTLDDGSVTNVPLTSFTKAFPLVRPIAAAVSPVDRTPVYSASPTFAFSASDESATGYRLQICRAGDTAATNCIYDSGVRLLPGRTGMAVGETCYEVTPPVFADMDVFAGLTTNRAVFADGTNYQWRVALFNAKYNEVTDPADWSGWATFQVDLRNENRYPRRPTGYGNATVAVRYYGPTNCAPKSVIVEAFENADFSGQPMAQVRLGGSGDLLRSVDDLVTPNAVLRGLTPGKVFFRAYIDQNDDGIRESWESWGYANMVGKGVRAIYNPFEFTVSAATKDFAVSAEADFVITIEDCDVNKNEWADVADPFGDFKKEIPYWNEPLPLPQNPLADTDGDGMPDAVETWNEGITDPLVADGDFVPEAGDDVMAYLEEKRLMVTIEDGTVEGLRLLLADGETEKYRKSENLPAKAYSYATWYLYGPAGADGQVYGLGTNVEVTADWNIRSAATVTVVRVHAQVYAKKGFNTLTANPEAYAAGKAIDTKPFTALDRYLVIRYLEAIGATPACPEGYKSFEEYALMTGAEVWQNYLLMPGRADSNYDKIDDGWQLYVMYGDALRTVGAKSAGFTPSVTPWGAIGDSRALSPGGEGLSWSQEYDGGHFPTDPWSVDTDRDGVTDFYAYAYHLKGDDADKDFDGDGLANSAEFLITEVFKYAQLDPEDPKTDGYCVDYFRKVGELYLGEIFTDHDQVDDLWERAHPKAADRYAYDPARDDDGDGWSNYAEAQAGTDPTSDLEPGIDGYTLASHPVPTLETRITYAGGDVITAPIMVQAWNQATDPQMTGSPDAVWTLAGTVTKSDESKDSGSPSGSKYIGIKPTGRRTYSLGSGSITHGSVRVLFKDLNFCKAVYDGEKAVPTKIGRAEDAQWYYLVLDHEGVLKTAGGIFAEAEEVGTVDYETGEVTIDFDSKPLTGVLIGDPESVAGGESKQKSGSSSGESNEYDLLSLDQSYVLLTWSSSSTVGALNRTVYLSDADDSGAGSRGWVREGLNSFIAFADENGDQSYTPGEPFGFVRNVDVGWAGAELEIKLARASAITPRIDLTTGEGDRVASVYEATSTMALTDPLFLAFYGTNDALRVSINEWFSNRVTVVGGIGANQSARVRVVRYGIDDRFCASVGVGSATDGNEQLVMLDKRFDATTRPFLSEADFLGDGEFDIDWNTLSGSDFRDGFVVDETGTALGRPTTQSSMGTGPRGAGLVVSNMTYLVVLGDGPTYFNGSGDTNTTVCALATMVTRRFEVTRHLPVAENVETIVHGARPTFRWSIPDEELWAKAFGSSYTAFRLQILEADGKTVVYDSGVRRAPTQDRNGFFTWTADAYAGDQTTLGKVFGKAGNWSWRVAMYNAKFKPQAKDIFETWSNVVPFSTSVGTQQETDDNGYSSIDVSVKYTGPVAVLADCEDLAKTNGTVRIQAFTTADFSGEPVAQGFVTNRTALTDVTDNTANGRLIGLPSGTYYIRAYIDSNGNFKKDDWESWGAAKDAVVVKPNQLAPIVGLYIEDADTDQDWIPDAWEYVTPGYEIGRSDASVDPEGRIIFKKEIYDGIVSGKAGISRFLSGVTLTFFENFDAAKMLLPGMDETAVSAVDAIRKAVEKNIDPNSVKITSFVVDAGNGTDGKVILTVGAKATDSIAGYLFTPIYELTAPQTVTIKVYRKANLATAVWGDPVKVETVTITSSLEERIEVPLAGVDFNSGFYKVEIEQ